MSECVQVCALFIYMGCTVCVFVHEMFCVCMMGVCVWCGGKLLRKKLGLLLLVGVLSLLSGITKYHRLAGLNGRHLFLAVLRQRSPRSECGPVWFWLA